MIAVISKHVSPEWVKRKYNGGFSFLCFMDDYQEKKRWDDNLSDFYKKIELKSLLEETKSKIRGQFLEFIDNLGKNHNELSILSPVSEPNTYVSNLFLDCCRLKIIDELLYRYEDLIIIVDDPALFKAIEDLFTKKGLNIKTKKPIRFYLDYIKVLITPLFHILKFNISFFQNLFATKLIVKNQKLKTDEKKKNIILHTWIDDGSFAKDGTYKDRYFGRFIDWVEKEGYSLFIIPFIYNVTFSLRYTYRMLKESNKKFIIPFDYYGMGCFIKAIIIMLRILAISYNSMTFLNVDIAPLIKRERLKRTGGFLPFFMYLDLFVTLKQKGFRFDLAVDVFEGMIPERTWILGLKKAYPDIKTIGYQHTIFSKDLLCYFIYKGESLKPVIPQKIVCTGDMIKNMLLKEGLPENYLITGCALRYEYLWKKNELTIITNDTVKEAARNKILIGLPLQLSGAVELINILSGIATRRKDLIFFVKPHPMMKKSTILELLKNVKWPKYETYIAEGSMDEWIWSVDLLISIASASIMDALTAGKPVLIIGREGVLDLNPVDWIESEHTKVYYGEKDIENRINALLSMDLNKTINLKKFGKEIMMGCFNKVTDENLRTFIS